MIYDYKSDERIQCAIFECFCPLMEDIKDEFYNLRRYQAVNIYAPAWVCREILGRFMEEINDVFVHSENNMELLHKDENEILMELCWDGCIFVEEARGISGRFKNSDGDCINYVYDSFLKSDIDLLATKEEFILVFGFEDEDMFCEGTTEETSLNIPKCDIPDECCVNNNIEIKTDADDDMHGFTITESGDGYHSYYSFYSTEKLDMDGTMKILKALGFEG